ncbi:hypothetical protein LEMLEM_LOCUS27109 [Lemmus lemmus]
MKLGAFLLLVSLVTLSLEVQELQAAVRPLQLLGVPALSSAEVTGIVRKGISVSALGAVMSVLQVKNSFYLEKNMPVWNSMPKNAVEDGGHG